MSLASSIAGMGVSSTVLILASVAASVYSFCWPEVEFLAFWASRIFWAKFFERDAAYLIDEKSQLLSSIVIGSYTSTITFPGCSEGFDYRY